jgi:hypothetical protein
MNMFVFEEVAARKLTPTEAAEQLVQARQPEAKRRGLMHRAAFAIVMALLAVLAPSLADRRY